VSDYVRRRSYCKTYPTGPLHCRCNHVINQAVLIFQSQLRRAVFEFHASKKPLENQHGGRHTVSGSYFGGQIDWIIALEAVIERRAGEIFD
jgi:hypothetical protein